jgi:mono/diheme cytochrome c family protein
MTRETQLTQCFRDEWRETGAMPMQKMLICFVLSVFFLEAAINVNGDLARASDGGPQGADKNSSSGIASTHPTGDATRGVELYNASCVVCHGPLATGGIGPRLAGNPLLSNEQAFWKTVSEGRHQMPPLRDVLTEQQIADIQAWLKTVR